jgi:E3 ubiquitin-protein ligase SHPRH
LKKKEVVEDSSDEEDWKTDYTKTIYNGSPLTKTVENQQKITKKYPREKKNIKNRTVTVKTKSQAIEKYENVCSICLDNYSDTRSLLKCGHKFCNECIDEWIKTSTNCPNCRATFEEYVKITVDSKNKI